MQTMFAQNRSNKSYQNNEKISPTSAADCTTRTCYFHSYKDAFKLKKCDKLAELQNKAISCVDLYAINVWECVVGLINAY